MSSLAMHCLASALSDDSAEMPNDRFGEWFDNRADQHQFSIEQVPFDRLERWDFDPSYGSLRHSSGKFFSVGGLRVQQRLPGKCSWDQPILHQPEIGILGFVAKKIDGVLHFLAQAKMEPGNINCIQLSPTVQATYDSCVSHQCKKTHFYRPKPAFSASWPLLAGRMTEIDLTNALLATKISDTTIVAGGALLLLKSHSSGLHCPLWF